MQAACREAEAAKAETAKVRRQLEAMTQELKETECRQQAANQAINAYCEAIRAGAEPLQLEIAAFLRTLGLSAPDISPTANSSSRAIGDLSAAVAVRSLSAAICNFLPAGGGAEAAMTKA